MLNPQTDRLNSSKPTDKQGPKPSSGTARPAPLKLCPFPGAGQEFHDAAQDPSSQPQSQESPQPLAGQCPQPATNVATVAKTICSPWFPLQFHGPPALAAPHEVTRTALQALHAHVGNRHHSCDQTHTSAALLAQEKPTACQVNETRSQSGCATVATLYCKCVCVCVCECVCV